MTEQQQRRQFHTRGFTSLLVAVSVASVLISGVILYFTPQGRVAHWAGWTMAGLEKDEWAAIHMNCGLLFVLIASVHLYFNWRVFWNYIKTKAAIGLNLKRELTAAMVVGVFVIAGTTYNLPPFSTIVGWNDDIKAYWARRNPRPPYSHAEASRLEDFARRMGCGLEDVADALQSEGFAVSDTRITLEELGRQKGVAPSDVFEAIKKHCRVNDTWRGQGRGRGRGQGGRTTGTHSPD